MEYLYVLCKMFPVFKHNKISKWSFYIHREDFKKIKVLLNPDDYIILLDSSPFYETEFLIIKVKSNLWGNLSQIETNVNLNTSLEKTLITRKKEILRRIYNESNS